MIGLNKDILCQYVEYITNIRMQAVGLPLPFKVRSNPIPWINARLVSDNVRWRHRKWKSVPIWSVRLTLKSTLTN